MAAAQPVSAGTAIQQVISRIAEDRICQIVAVALQVCGSLQHQVFDVGSQPIVSAGVDRIRTLAGILKYRIGKVVDKVGVVAGPADHEVGACVAVENIVSAVAVEGVAEAVAVALQVGTALQDQVFHVGRQPEMRRRIDRVGALAGILKYRVGKMVNEISIVAVAARHLVRAGAAVEGVLLVSRTRWPTTVCVASIKSLAAVPLMLTPNTF